MDTTPAVQSRFVQIDGRRVHYVQAGSGQPVILLHGVNASVVDWHLAIPALAERFAVTAIDLPGFGDSAIPDHTHGMGETVHVLDALLDRLGGEVVSFVGNSMGGLICGHYAIARPRRVRRLMLVSPAGLAADLPLHLRLLSLPVPVEWAMRPSRNAGKIAARGLFADPSRAPVAWLAAKQRERSLAARRYMLSAFRSGTNIFGLRQELIMLDGLRALDIPTLVVWGAQDKVISPRHLQVVKAYLPRANTYEFACAGHVPMLECPEEFNRLALDFLAG